MKLIPLTKGKFAKVDDEDFEYLNKFKWNFHDGYARGWINKSEVLMHRVILNNTTDEYTDHINGNRSDNRRSNLRFATNSQNQANMKLPKDNTSGCKGVCYAKYDKKWKSRIMVKGKRILLGYFLDKNEAVQAYKNAAIKYFGEYANY
jgi:hypothetical protein